MCAFSELAFKKPALKYPSPTATPLSPASRHWSADADKPCPNTVGRGTSTLEALGTSHAFVSPGNVSLSKNVSPPKNESPPKNVSPSKNVSPPKSIYPEKKMLETNVFL